MLINRHSKIFIQTSTTNRRTATINDTTSPIMSSLQEFSLFPLLPKELRLQIWESTFSPRLLSLQYIKSKGRKGWPCLQQMLCYQLQYPRQYPTPPDDQRIPLSRMPEWLAQVFRLILVSADPISTMSVCHESRACGIRSGYRTWKLRNHEGYEREVFWNPIFDTVAFVGPYSENWIPDFLTRIFMIEFPSQTQEIQKMALPTTSWRHWDGENFYQTAFLLPYESLREIVFVLDEPWERRNIEKYTPHSPFYRKQLAGGLYPFELPRDIEKVLENDKKKHAPARWKVPAVRVVREESEILGQTSTKMVLRCFPCPDLGMWT